MDNNYSRVHILWTVKGSKIVSKYRNFIISGQNKYKLHVNHLIGAIVDIHKKILKEGEEILFMICRTNYIAAEVNG